MNSMNDALAEAIQQILTKTVSCLSEEDKRLIVNLPGDPHWEAFVTAVKHSSVIAIRQWLDGGFGNVNEDMYHKGGINAWLSMIQMPEKIRNELDQIAAHRGKGRMDDGSS